MGKNTMTYPQVDPPDGIFDSIADWFQWVHDVVKWVRETYIEPIFFLRWVATAFEYVETGAQGIADWFRYVQDHWDSVWEHISGLWAWIDNLTNQQAWRDRIGDWFGIEHKFVWSWGGIVQGILKKYATWLYYLLGDPSGTLRWEIGGWLGLSDYWRQSWWHLISGIFYVHIRPLYDLWNDPNATLRGWIGDWFGLDPYWRQSWWHLWSGILYKHSRPLYDFMADPGGYIRNKVGDGLGLPEYWRQSWWHIFSGFLFIYARPLYDLWADPKGTVTNWVLSHIDEHAETLYKTIKPIGEKILKYIWEG